MFMIFACNFLLFATIQKGAILSVAKRGSVFIGLMTSDGAIWFRYQRAVLMRGSAVAQG